jgi:hypothetical protein
MTRDYQGRGARLLRVAVGFFVLLTCLRVWTVPPRWAEPALAQIPDSGLQRKEMLDEARRTNELLSDIKRLLQEHTFNVTVVGADKQSPPPAKAGGGGL